MVKLLDQDIRTREVLGWKGLHLFHAQASSCSQKVRIALNMKGVRWKSHTLDILNNEHIGEFFLGVNPRGLVPVLVDDGQVHIESNDILLHIENRFKEPMLVPAGATEEVEALLKLEDDLHLDLRVLSFRFMYGSGRSPKTPEALKKYASTGSGTVGGVKDLNRDREVAFWSSYAVHGISDESVRGAAMRFFNAFEDLEKRLAKGRFLLGDSFSLLDIAWIVYGNRLRLAGYPFGRLHPRFSAWLMDQARRSEIAGEIAPPAAVAEMLAARQNSLAKSNASLEQLCFS